MHTPPSPSRALVGIPVWLPILLGVLTAVGPLSTDMYLPAFPAIETDLHLPQGQAQITLASWFAGLAVGQIAQGTLADRYGRRTPLIVGTLVYAAANAACALATDLFWLSTFRAIAALGGSASMVIPRAIVRDLAEGHAAARLMSRLILVMGAAPILAPTLGAALLGIGSWHNIFWLTTAYGAISTVLVALFLPDTLPRERRISLGATSLLRRYAGVLRDRSWRAYSLVGGFGMFGMFAYIGASPPVLIGHLMLTPAQYALAFSIGAGSFILGSQISPRLLPRWGSAGVLRAGVRGYVLATATLLGLSFLNLGTGALGVAAVVLPVMGALGSMGFVMPNAAVGALSRQGAQAGTASALMGMLQFALAAVSGVIAGVITDGTPRPMAALMLAGALGALAAELRAPRTARTPPLP